MIFLDELDNLKLYKKKLFLPINEKNKRKGSAVFLLTPNYASSKNLLTNDNLIPKWFESYYIEKDISYIINQEGFIVSNSDIEYDTLNENVEESYTRMKVKDHPLYEYLKEEGYSDDEMIEVPTSDIEGIDVLEADIPNTLKNPKSLQRALKIRMRKSINRVKRIDPTDPSNTAKQVEKLHQITEKFETRITEPFLGKNTTLYHGSSEKLNKIIPNSKNYGTRLSKERYSSFWCLDPKYPSLLSIYKVIFNNADNKIDILFTDNAENEYMYIVNTFHDQVKDILSKNPYYIYEKNIKTKFIGRGHSLNENEFTLDFEVIPDKVTANYWQNAAKFIKFVSKDEYEKIKNELSSKKYKNTIRKKIVYHSEDEMEKLINKTINQSVQESYQIGHIYGSDSVITQMGIQTNEAMILFNENVDERIMTEANKEYNPILHKLLYAERYKTPKEVLSIYDTVKIDIPYITKTYLEYSRYQQLNLFIDMSFYNQTFFKNNIYKLDRGVDLYFEFITRFLKDPRLSLDGYTKKTVFIPVEDWTKPDVAKVYRYTEDLNPISLLYRMIESSKLDIVKEEWKDITLVFLSKQGYFKVDVNSLNNKDTQLIPALLNKLKSNNTVIPDDGKESPKAIVANLVDKVEDSQNIQINNLTGKAGKQSITKAELNDKLNNSITSKDDIDINKNTKSDESKDNVELKDDLVDKLKDAAKDASSTEDALDNIDDDHDIKKIIDSLSAQEDNSVKINAVRAARINKLQNEFLDSKLKEKTVREMIISSTANQSIPKTELKIDSVNEQWKDLHYINFENSYNPSEDIVGILNSLSTKTVPVMIRNLNVEDSSTTEDYKETWSVEMEDVNGTRFTLRFDIPKFKEDKFMLLGGNEKTINGQLVLLPIIKTDQDTVQIISNYKKIFISRFGTSKGKSTVVANRLIKALSKDNTFKITNGDCTKICSKYELPIDYIDLSSQYSTIESKKHIFYLNQDIIREKYKDKIDLKKGIPVGIEKPSNNIIYYTGEGQFANLLRDYLITDEPSFEEIYEKTTVASRYTYSKASILSTEIPLIVIMAYNEGLVRSMKKAHIKYEILEKRPSYDKNYQDIIKFKDAYILYDLNYNSSLLMNGLKECGTELYSIEEINNKTMYLDFLDLFGGRLRADGLDNFYDMMIDEPITKEVLEHYKLPTDYIEILAYANSLLADNKYIKHTDQRGRRYRSNEIVAGYAYQAIADAYGEYRTRLKRTPKSTITMKQNEIINRILLDPTASDLSTLSPILELECINTVSTKGLVGMNADRGYSLDKRTYDTSMINVLGLSTGFAGNVGIARQATIDMNVEGKRGYIKITDDVSDLNVTKSLTITEALTPFGTNMDDPFRSAMTFIQTSKHGMRIEKASPMLITNGADEALPYMVTDKFAFKAKADGKVIEKTDDYMILEYKTGKKDYVDLRSNVKKNSDGGFYLTLKLDSDYKVGNTFKAREILAYDKLSFSDKIGHTDDIAYNLGAMVKIAILNSDEGFEDSAIISEYLSNAMASDVVLMKDISLPKNTNVYNIVKAGDPVQEGDPLIIFQNAFEEDDANLLLKNLAGEEEDISDLGRIRIKSKITGTVEDVKIYRTVEIDELSDSLKKAVNQSDKPTKQLKSIMKKYDIDEYNKLNPDYKLDPTGKLKKAYDGVLIEFYLKYKDKMSVGDKLIYYSALKGVIKDIFPVGKEPFSNHRKQERIDTILCISGVGGRMTCSVIMTTIINKALIELDRAVKTELNIPFKYLDED